MTHLLPYLLLSLGINLLVLLPAYFFRTDKLTDITYSLTFITLMVTALITNTSTSMGILLVLLISLWAVRLGAYLFIRVHRMGRDSRFDEMHNHFFRYAGFWLLQGLAVFLISIPALFLIENSSQTVHWISLVGVVIFFVGWAMEGLADLQKFRFKQNPANTHRWTDVGLWKRMRHPNYLGEMMVWVGIYLYAFPGLSLAQAAIGLISPLFIIVLLRFVSGIPLLEKSALEKWGSDPAYQQYRKQTGMLFPKWRT